ncbi:hypothetical protein L596_021538 [Steinernema carpocapsae]|uniref:Receptor ligand binding region domain-containing protein n=1 Tax=Steinernema carpocapsae TaxID=34508 RepID=A0A4V6XVW4_STECR|nr:hypothetical protein L596_021538 [Steinernema carpocapsae]
MRTTSAVSSFLTALFRMFLRLGLLLCLIQGTVAQFPMPPPPPLQLKIGLLIPKNEPELAPKMGYRRSAAAVTLAFDRIMHEQLLPKDTNLSVVWKIEECDEKTASGLTFDLITKDNVDMIIASPCNEPAIMTSTIAAYYDRPVFLWGATTSGDFSQMDRFPTIATVVPNTSDMANTICRMMNEFHWRNFALVYTSTDIKGEKCGYLQKDLEGATDKYMGCNIAYKRRVIDWHEERINETLRQIRENARSKFFTSQKTQKTV